MTTTTSSLTEAHEANRRRLVHHVATMQRHKARNLADRQQRVDASLESLRRERKRSVTYRVFLYGLAASLIVAPLLVLVFADPSLTVVELVRTKTFGFLLFPVGVGVAYVARMNSPLIGLSDDQLLLDVERRIGGREVTPGEAAEVIQLIGEHPQFAPFLQRWLEQGDGRLSIDEAFLLQDAAKLQSSLDASEEDLAEGGYPARLAQAANEAAARVAAELQLSTGSHAQ